jgi:hypothetical protein
VAVSPVAANNKSSGNEDRSLYFPFVMSSGSRDISEYCWLPAAKDSRD